MTLDEAVLKCNNELAKAIHLSETAPNVGLQVIYDNRAEWLCQVLWAARQYKNMMEVQDAIV